MSLPICAIAAFDSKIKGTVRFTETPDNVEIEIHLTGLKKNHLHGFHVNECGDIRKHAIRSKWTRRLYVYIPYNKITRNKMQYNRKGLIFTPTKMI